MPPFHFAALIAVVIATAGLTVAVIAQAAPGIVAALLPITLAAAWLAHRRP